MAGEGMVGIRKFLILLAVACLLPSSYAPAQLPTSPDPKQLELQTLRDQLTEPSRSAKTRYEAARILLSRDYAEARAVLLAAIKDSTNPAAQAAVAQAIAQDGNAGSDFIDPLLSLLTGSAEAIRPLAARALVTFQNHGATDRLISVARDRSQPQAIRLVTIEAMQRLPSKSSIGALVDLLSDKDAPVRAAAAESLAKLTNITTFGDDADQWRAWWAKNRDKSRQDWLSELAESLTRSKMSLERDNAQLRERLVKALEDLYNATPRTQRPAALLDMLADPVPDVRLLGATLVERRIAANDPLEPELRQRLRALLDDADPRLRQIGATVEAGLADEGAAELLLRHLKDEADPAVRVGLLRALGKLKSREALSAVLNVALTGRDAEAAAAAEAVTRIASDAPLTGDRRTDAARVLLQRYALAVQGKDGQDLREALLTAMGAVADPLAVEALTGALDDPAGVIRLAGVTGLARVNAEGSADRLAKAIADPDRGVRQAAIVALGKVGGADYLKAILERTDPKVESDPTVRAQALEQGMALSRTIDADGLAEILKGLDDQPGTADLRIRLLGLYADALGDEATARRLEALSRLCKELFDAGRPDEAVDTCRQAWLLSQKLKRPADEQNTRWLRYVDALLAKNDASTVATIAEQSDAAAFAQAVAAVRQRLAALHKADQCLPAVALANAALKQWPDRLSEDDVQALTNLRDRAVARQGELDLAEVHRLAPQLVSVDAKARTTAMDQLKALGTRAVKPLLTELRTLLQEEAPDVRLEKAVLDALQQVDGGFGAYDLAADRVNRIRQVDEWLENR